MHDTTRPYRLYETDTACSLSAGILAEGEWLAAIQASSHNPRKPASYAVWQALMTAKQAARRLATGGGETLHYHEYSISDDGTIAAAVAVLRGAIAARTAQFATQPQPPTYFCAGLRDGCQQLVHVRGEYCPSCVDDR